MLPKACVAAVVGACTYSLAWAQGSRYCCRQPVVEKGAAATQKNEGWMIRRARSLKPTLHGGSCKYCKSQTMSYPLRRPMVAIKASILFVWHYRLFSSTSKCSFSLFLVVLAPYSYLRYLYSNHDTLHLLVPPLSPARCVLNPVPHIGLCRPWIKLSDGL